MKSLTIGANDAGQRLDRFLAKAFPHLGHGMIRKALRNKDIKINKKRTTADYKLVFGDELEIYLPDIFLKEKSKPGIVYTIEKPQIIYEDDNILLVDKPAGIPVHEDNEKSIDTLISRIISYLAGKGEYNPEAEQSFCPALCNRIDRNTTGIVIAAKNADALRIMTEKIRKREVQKLYLCLVSGKMPKKSDILTAFLEKNEIQNRVYISSRKNDNNLTIKTKYTVLAEQDDISLLEIELLTGRTHQIRAHMASIGHPIVGDPKYGSNRINREKKAKTQALCSYKIRFDFKTDSGILAYLTGKEFETANVPFADKLRK